MEFYIARDVDGRLFLYSNLPIKDENSGIFKLDLTFRDSKIFNIDSKLFPEITYENSPQQVELKLIKNDSNS